MNTIGKQGRSHGGGVVVMGVTSPMNRHLCFSG